MKQVIGNPPLAFPLGHENEGCLSRHGLFKRAVVRPAFKALRSVLRSTSRTMRIYLALWPILWGVFCIIVTKAQSEYQEGKLMQNLTGISNFLKITFSKACNLHRKKVYFLLLFLLQMQLEKIWQFCALPNMISYVTLTIYQNAVDVGTLTYFAHEELQKIQKLKRGTSQE